MLVKKEKLGKKYQNLSLWHVLTCHIFIAQKVVLSSLLAFTVSYDMSYKAGSLSLALGSAGDAKSACEKGDTKIGASTSMSSLFTDASKEKFAGVFRPKELAKKSSTITEKPDEEEIQLAGDRAARDLTKKARRVKKPRKEKKPEATEDEANIEERELQIQAKPTKRGIEKESRTVFLGNVPIAETIKSLTKMCSEFGEVESVRLRSVPVAGTAVDEAGNQDLVKKVCSNKKEYGQQKGSLNAYVVFKKFESVAKALEANNRFMWGKQDGENRVGGRHLRVDLVNPTLFDPKRSVFIGALPHYADEEEVRAHFATVLPNGHDDIENIRIVRDAETMIGKGIGYLLFKDRDAVMQALTLHNAKYKKRWELRVSVCGKRTKRTVINNKTGSDISSDKVSKKSRLDLSESPTGSREAADGEKNKSRWRNRDPADVPERKPSLPNTNAAAAAKRLGKLKNKALKTTNTRKQVLKERGQMKKEKGRKGKRLGGVVKAAMKAAKGK